eukprot:2328122-Ditylum_brightwellii.AAC.1
MDQQTQNVLDRQVRKAFALKHSMSASDCLLFHTDLEDHMKSSPESKRLWLESVHIAFHAFTVTALNQSTSPDNLLSYNNANTAPIPALGLGALLVRSSNAALRV